MDTKRDERSQIGAPRETLRVRAAPAGLRGQRASVCRAALACAARSRAARRRSRAAAGSPRGAPRAPTESGWRLDRRFGRAAVAFFGACSQSPPRPRTGSDTRPGATRYAASGRRSANRAARNGNAGSDQERSGRCRRSPRCRYEQASEQGRGHAPEPSSVDTRADLSEQLRLIDAARSAVAAGNAPAASAALSSYRARFPRGLFGQEAAVLQIETLDLQGNHALAAAQARSFLARHPNSPHVGVVQRIAGR